MEKQTLQAGKIIVKLINYLFDIHPYTRIEPSYSKRINLVLDDFAHSFNQHQENGLAVQNAFEQATIDIFSLIANPSQILFSTFSRARIQFMASSTNGMFPKNDVVDEGEEIVVDFEFAKNLLLNDVIRCYRHSSESEDVDDMNWKPDFWIDEKVSYYAYAGFDYKVTLRQWDCDNDGSYLRVCLECQDSN